MREVAPARIRLATLPSGRESRGPSMLIRYAEKRDAAPLAELAARTFFDTFGADNTEADMAAHLAHSYSPSIQESEISNDSIRTLVTDHESRLIAFAQLRMGAAPECVPGAQTVEIWRFYVDKPYIGRGVSGALMERVIAELKLLNSDVTWLGVWERNFRAQAFYRKVGFRQVGTQIYHVGSDPQIDLVMACRTIELSVPRHDAQPGGSNKPRR